MKLLEDYQYKLIRIAMNFIFQGANKEKLIRMLSLFTVAEKDLRGIEAGP